MQITQKVIFSLPLVAALLSSLLSAEESAHTVAWRVPLKEVGQSNVVVQGEHLYLTIHAPLEQYVEEPPRSKEGAGKSFSSNVIGQCFNKHTGHLKWEVALPGTAQPALVLESWHDATSLGPVADKDSVIFQNLNGMLLCCDHAGKQRWQRSFEVPRGDVKNSRMFLRDGRLLVALPAETFTDKKPLYQLHAIDLDDGHDIWVSSVTQSLATQYSLGQWHDQEVVISSLINLSHWKFGQSNEAYLVSLKDGSLLQTIPLPENVYPHQKSALYEGQYILVQGGRKTGISEALFQCLDAETGQVTREFRFAKPDKYFQRSKDGYALAEYAPHFAKKGRVSRYAATRIPTPSTMHIYEDKLFYWTYSGTALGCIDLKSGETILVDLPLQVLGDRTIWDYQQINFTPRVANAKGKVVRIFDRGNVRGPFFGGFGHVNPAYPVRHGNTLYWQGGIGMLYMIDLNGKFGPEKVSWTSIDDVGRDWTFGAPAVDEDGIYVRSQRQLVKLNHPKTGDTK